MSLPDREEIAEILRDQLLVHTAECIKAKLWFTPACECKKDSAAIPRMADALLARLRPAWEPKTPEEIHKKLGAMMDEEERLMDRLEELGDTTYAVSDECVERTRKNLTVIMDLTQQRDALRADLTQSTAALDEMVIRHNYAQADLRACAEALFKFGVHFAPCPYNGTTARIGPQDRCSCGLTAALTRPGVQAEMRK